MSMREWMVSCFRNENMVENTNGRLHFIYFLASDLAVRQRKFCTVENAYAEGFGSISLNCSAQFYKKKNLVYFHHKNSTSKISFPGQNDIALQHVQPPLCQFSMRTCLLYANMRRISYMSCFFLFHPLWIVHVPPLAGELCSGVASPPDGSKCEWPCFSWTRSSFSNVYLCSCPSTASNNSDAWQQGICSPYVCQLRRKPEQLCSTSTE